MTADLKYLLPFLLPFILLGTLRLLWMAAGADWPDSAGMIAFFSFMFGVIIGGTIVAAMAEGGICWNVTIWSKRQ